MTSIPSLHLHAIFLATEGEGVHIGTPQVFVRVQGCDVHCTTCDSKETWCFEEGTERGVDAIVAAVTAFGVPRVSVTGGDPLHPRHRAGLIALLHALRAHGFFINIEVTGLELADDVFSLVDYISMDYKTPSSGIRGRTDVLSAMAQTYPNQFQIKSVIHQREDFEHVLALYRTLAPITFPWVLTPSYETEEQAPMKRFQRVLEWNQQEGGPFRVIGQQHKWVFGPKTRNV